MPLAREPNAVPIPGYRLIEPLGRGGFGEVWKCEAPGGLHKAIKYVFGNLNAIDAESVRAEQEHQALERVKMVRHPFILTTERVEIIAGELLIVMELADKNLHDVLMEHQARGLPGIPREDLLNYLRDAAEALDLMNVQHDLQHLDVKPRNLFLVSNRVKVADFGLVKDLEGRGFDGPTDVFLGGVTPLYGAPETFQGIISRHSDQYSLAIVYQELLTGVRPFSGKNPRALALQHLKEQPDLSSLPDADRPIVARALAKDPRQRYPSCLAFMRALQTGSLEESPARRQAKVAAVAAGSGLSIPDTMEELLLSPVDPALVFKREAGLGEQQSPPQEADEISRSVTVAQPMTGSLKPTLVIGLGAFGRQALQALRCRIIDRFGSVAKLPLLRFLYLDTNADSLKAALHAPPEQALPPSETFHLPLQPVGHYRRNRQIFDRLTEWMPLEKLYTIPRSLETQGTRALGRLAFADNYLRLAARLKRELQVITDPDHLYQAVNRTGLPLRSEVPQVFLLSSAAGGTGSGMLLDAAYTLRRLLHDMKKPTAEIIALLLCGAPNDPAAPVEEQANLYATLTEINHFSDPNVVFSAHYGVDGPLLREAGPPLNAVYLIPLGHRSPEGVSETASRAASYVYHDATTPLGIRLAYSRQTQLANSETPFRSFGTYGVWFPRGLLLRIAARKVCQRLLNEWLRADDERDWRHMYQSCDPVLNQPHWDAEHIRGLIDQAATTGVEGTPSQALTAFLATLEAQAEQSVSRDDPANWCRMSLERIREWVGSGVSAAEETSEWRKSRVHRMFSSAIQKVADDYVELLAQPVRELFDAPSCRWAAADAAYARFIKKCEDRVLELENTLRAYAKATEHCWQQVDVTVQACLAGAYGGFSLFGGSRTRKMLRAFVERINAYSRQRLAEESARSVQHFYHAIQNRLQDLRRDLSFCQQRLKHLENVMAAALEVEEDLATNHVDLTPEPVAGLPPAAISSKVLADVAAALASRIVLPEGASDLFVAAAQFLDGLTTEQWRQLDLYLQEHVLVPLGGLHQVCITSSDLVRNLGGHLLEGAADYLGQQLPVTDVSEAELSAAEALHVDLAAQSKAYFTLATPSICVGKGEREESFLLTPNSDAGKKLGEIAKQALPGLHVVGAPNQADLLICREQSRLGLAELRQLLAPCKRAYIFACSSPAASPHARNDILDWIPLDP